MGKKLIHGEKKSALIMAVAVGGTEKEKFKGTFQNNVYLDRVVSYKGMSLISASNCNI